MKKTVNSDSFEALWLSEIELKACFSNRLFCAVFIICNPVSSISYYLSDDPFFAYLFPAHLISSLILLVYIILHYKKVITGQQLSFFSYATLIFFYAFLLSRPHLSYVQSSLNLTLAVVFASLILRWPLKYALVSSVLSLVLFPLAIYWAGHIPLIKFFEQGGIFVLAANLLFPLVTRLSYRKDKREFYFRYTLQKQNEALEEQKTIAENATKAKSNFLSMMSHEIRTPLNGIVGMVHLMLQEEETASAKPNELLQTLKFSADQLMAVVNDVLDFNKINSNHVTLDPQPFDPDLLFGNLLRTFLPKASEKGIALVFDIAKSLPAQLIADPVRLNQIITNLVHNAIKFTSAGYVRCSVRELARDASFVQLHFEVADSGVGIPQEDQVGIFEIFTQVNNPNHRENAGTGLGLAIAKELLRLFNSDIKLVSEVGKGSVFSFSLKLAYSNERLHTQPAEKELVTSVSFPRVKVLVVDDNHTNIVLATQLLKRREILFDVAVNGQEAYELFGKNNYDLILMDLRMPVMDGFESTRLIREINKTIPIIALTASAFEDERERALRNGFSGYLTKPFLPDDFYKYIFPFLGVQTTQSQSAI